MASGSAGGTSGMPNSGSTMYHASVHSGSVSNINPSMSKMTPSTMSSPFYSQLASSMIPRSWEKPSGTTTQRQHFTFQELP